MSLTINYLQNNYNNIDIDNIQNIRTDFYKKKIKSQYDNDRIVFTNNPKYKIHYYDDNMNIECNGLIYNYKTNKPLVIPYSNTIKNFDGNIINKYLNENLYDIYYIEDSTFINLYFYNNKWIISTRSSYEANNTKLGNSITFEDALNDILLNNNININKFYDDLDKNSCHTFSIRHPKFHLFDETNSKSTEINNYKITYYRSVNLDSLKIEYKEFDNKIKLPRKLIINKPINLKNLLHKTRTAFKNYIHNSSIFYGYVLRKKKNTFITGSDSNIIIISSLYKSIQQIIYNYKINILILNNQFNREKYLIINYLKKKYLLDTMVENNYNNNNIKNIKNYKTLFPKLFNKSIEYNNKINEMVEYINNCVNSNSYNLYDKDDEKLISFTKYVINNINKKLDIYNFDNNYRINIITDYIFKLDDIILYNNL
tara:strand:- start:678 stop:1958 length:1281 start_codon:yes stop_codon:yes gene_type:complete